MSEAFKKIYEALDYTNGDLLSASAVPTSCDWMDKGEWLLSAQNAGASKVFFVENNPVIVFAECSADYSDKINTFNKVWSLARPRILFLSSPGEITVYDLAQEPVNPQGRELPKNKRI